MEDNEMYNKENIIINGKEYNIKLYTKRNVVVFELESSEKKYSNSFSLNDLIKIYRIYFIDYTNINAAFSGLKELFEENIQNFLIIEEDNSIIFNIKKKNGKEIIFSLEKKKDEIYYDSLSEEMKKIIDNNELILGIDFGTTYSCASVMLDDKKIIIKNSLGERTTPSFVLFLEDNKISVGELAKLQPSYCKNIIFNIKRLIGKNYNNSEVQSIKNNCYFKIKNDNDFNLLKIEVNDKEYYPEQISAMILKNIINDSEYYLKKLLGKEIKIKNSVITAPAYFNQLQRKSILNAANIINLNVKRIINEPTAASLAYLYENFNNVEKDIIVFDFGGGTFDITLLHLTQEESSSYCDIKCTGGDPNFGGEDFDDLLMKKSIESTKNNIYHLDKKLPQNIRLKRACENAKIKLSSQNDTIIFVEEYLPSLNIDFKITKDKFEEYCKELFDKFENIIKNFLEKNNVDKTKISEVIPIGGSTLIPKIRIILEDLFPNSKFNYNLNPKEVVATGAAIQGGILSKINSLKDYNLFDITNNSLGVELVGEKMSKIINKYSHIPIQYKREYFNAYDNATELLIKVYEGENNNVKNNIFLGEFKIKNLPKNKKSGEIYIDVSFNIDENSLLYVKAIEKENINNYSDNLFNLGKNNERKIKNNRFPIEEPRSLMNIIDNLKNKENSMNYVDVNLYIDTIKDSIIESENKIIKLAEKNNLEGIMKEREYILEKFETFIRAQLSKNTTEEYEKNLFLSYVKYYFKKINNFLKIYKDSNFKEKILENNIIKVILETIQFYDTQIIFEIIEDFSDDKEIFEKCIIASINNLYGKFNVALNHIDFKNIYDYNRIILYNLEKKADGILSLFEKLKPEQIPTDIKFVPEFLKSFKLKIKVKKLILDYKSNKNNSVYFSIFGIRFYKKGKRNELRSLIEEYNNINNPYIDVDLLNDLQNLENANNSNTTQCDIFLSRSNSMIDAQKDEIYLLHISEEFKDKSNNITMNFDIIHKRKSAVSSRVSENKLDVLNKALVEYKESLNLIKNDLNEEKLIEVYDKIILIINLLKNRISNNK